MRTVEKMTDEELARHALDILGRELGLGGLARFLRVYRSGTGDYTSERERWLKTANVQELTREIGKSPVL